MGKKIYPTCRICDKLNAEMTHCAIFGPLDPNDIDNTAIGAACAKSGDFVRFIHAVPNEYNFGKTLDGRPKDEAAESELLIYDANDEKKGFEIKHGMTLEEWARITFGKKSD
ncbi:hypothetical protein Theco_4097 (plasmid) [Thermobacillus composti KWC4]|uniref:Uncharacterized protein n=1 Tax=Thermobacillus composti (strain DSM 18247 / JCM 13945 / KWC4) TaxID=717605 RepID=L0EK74_THECK|nr:hypothetical protein [Thermobacillus composti]AGA60094.1 hypothetical protein Theco_4097 [Thermobacillus composti KWC4]